MRLPFGFELTRRKGRDVQASFDAAETNVDNEQHWSATDALSPDSSASPEVRKTLRERARYEIKNNSFARGIVETIANDTIGTGPRLLMLNKDQRDIQIAWKKWCKDTAFCQKLRTMRKAKIQDGEAIARFVNNMRLPEVKLDLRLYETEQMADPWYSWMWPKQVSPDAWQEELDGVEVDGQGNALRYHLLHIHPGASRAVSPTLHPGEGDWVRKERIIHLYRVDRPGQHRGIPEITPALPLFAILRRYSLSALAAAETAADLAAVLKTDGRAFSPIDASSMDEVDMGTALPIRRRTIMALPFGWEIQQMRAEQPATTYREFRDAILCEIARCLNIPFNIAAGNSSEYNYASGRLDHQTYFRAIDIERDDIIKDAVEKVFEAWLQEYLAIKSGIRPSDVDLKLYPHRWFWQPHPHVDPEKNAKATEILWNLGLVSDEDVLVGEMDKDPEDHYAELEASQPRRQAMGLPQPGVAMQSIKTDDSDENSAVTNSATE